MKTNYYFFLLLVFPFYVSFNGSGNSFFENEEGTDLFTGSEISGNHVLKKMNSEVSLFCEAPTVTSIKSIKQTRAIVRWSLVEGAEKYEFELGAPGFVPGSGQEIQKSLAIGLARVIEGLTKDTQYEIAFRSICDNGDTSAYSSPVTFRTSASCGDRFFDPGGPDSDYNANLEVTQRICPDQPDQLVQLEFGDFDLVGDTDFLRLYSGSSTGSSVIGTWYAGEHPGKLHSLHENGCVFAQFVSGENTGAGWDANISCISCLEPYDIGFEYNWINSRVEWKEGAPFHTKHSNIEFGEVGFTPGTGSYSLVKNTFSPSFFTNSLGLDNDKPYDFYIRSICKNGDSTSFVGPYYLHPTTECGMSIYDGGGPDNPYDKGVYVYELCPEVPGTAVQLDFTELDVDPCCASLQVITGPFFEIEIPLDGSLPDPIVAPGDDGCLELRFDVFAEGNFGEGWEATVECVCPEIDRLRVGEVTSTFVRFFWEGNFSADNDREWAIMPKGHLPGSGTPVASGTMGGIALSTTVSFLEPNTEYDLYGKINCPPVPTDFGPAFPFRTAPTCGEYHYDFGGSGQNYPITAGDYNTLMCPDENWQVMELTFEEFDLHPTDVLIVGRSDELLNTSVIGQFSGDSIPASFIGTNYRRCLFTNFNIFNNIPFPGWKAKVNCLDCPPTFEMVSVKTDFQDSTTIRWKRTIKAVSYQYEIGLPGFQPNTNDYVLKGVATNDSAKVKVGGLAKSTIYEIYLKGDCGAFGSSYWSRPFKFMTSPACGEVIYDPGGPNDPYENNELFFFSVCPDLPTELVTVEFSLFNTQLGRDVLKVYRNEIHPALLLNNLSGNIWPDPISAPQPGDCLLFKFNSDETTVGLGWEAVVMCGLETLATERQPNLSLAIHPNPFRDVFTVVYHAKKKEMMDLAVFDLSGKKAFENQVPMTPGTNEIEINLSGFPAGVYVVKLNNAEKLRAKRILKF